MGDYGERLRDAKREWEADHDPESLSWAEVARQCTEILKRTVHAETVRLMAAAKQEPTVAEFRALGSVLGKDPAWLAFGDPRGPAREEIQKEAKRTFTTEKVTKTGRRGSQ